MTTPRDFALLSRHLLLNTDILKYTSVKVRPFGRPVRIEAVEMRNHNNLLGKVAGVDGLKTGFTNGAGYCIATTGQRAGRRLIVVVMGSPDSNTRDLKVSELLERGFAAMPAAAPPAPAPGNSPILPVPMINPASRPAPVTDSPPAIKFSVPKKK